MNDRCGEKGCPGGHTDLQTQHCNPRQLVNLTPDPMLHDHADGRTYRRCPMCVAKKQLIEQEQTVPDTVEGFYQTGPDGRMVVTPVAAPVVLAQVVVAVKRNQNCPKCGHRSFFRRCKCGGMLW